MLEEAKKVVIVGGGITGITAAYYLQKQAKEKSLPLTVMLIEATPRLGGKIKTIHKDGFIIERGPDSFLARKNSAARLAEAVGLSDQLVTSANGRSYVIANGQLHPLPGKTSMGILTQLSSFLTSSLFTIPGKIRACADFILPKSHPQSDQSLGRFFRRRLGDEAVENLIEPLLSGIYAGDIDKLSLMATFPRFYELEQTYRSLLIGMTRTMSASEQARGKDAGAFMTLKNGLETLVEAIEENLEEGSVLKGTRVDKIEMGAEGAYHLALNSGKTIRADSVVVATPHPTLPAMMPQYSFFAELKDMAATSVATVAMAFPKEAMAKNMNGTGFVVSRNSDFTVTACTWTHKKWPHTAPEGKGLLRCYIGRSGDETVVELSDAEIEHIVMEDLNKAMDIPKQPEFTIVSRWEKAMPQYTVGHKERLAEMRKQMNQDLPGLFIAGSSFAGVGLPDCIDQGEAAVRKVLDYLQF
ncbi:protoporphyrinogen oxidase [Bacillus xiapuensis]|uniref:protoporphyrinogen oxidase n=1 Tax=Bacillus xiapuensis TaxID=2014075 RepID=UPI000C249790|nr:protoporphyrinogen oxidase [Bacillus xiapuensis]